MAPLHGLKVLDLTSVVMGPYCTTMLRHLGAEVIKLESLDGDITRSIGPMTHDGQSGSFASINNGKRSIAVDLQDERGREICLNIARRSDILIHSIRPDALQRLRLNYASIAAVNPTIIYCNLLGFGRRGCYFGKPAYDDTIQALSGLAMLQGEQLGYPVYVTSVFADKLAGLMGAYAVLAAVVSRDRTGAGQEIDVPMFETMAACLLAEHATGAVFKPPLSRPVYSRLVSRHRRPFATKSGYLSIMVYNDKHWQAFCAVADRKDLLQDPRFANFSNRTHNVDDYYALISEIVLTRTAEEWQPLLEQVQIPCAQVNRLDDLSTDPHLRDVGFFAEFRDQWNEPLQLPRFPVEFSGTPALEPSMAPLLGEHSRLILSDCGYPDAEIEMLIQAGAVRASEPQQEFPKGPLA